MTNCWQWSCIAFLHLYIRQKRPTVLNLSIQVYTAGGPTTCRCWKVAVLQKVRAWLCPAGKASHWRVVHAQMWRGCADDISATSVRKTIKVKMLKHLGTSISTALWKLHQNDYFPPHLCHQKACHPEVVTYLCILQVAPVKFNDFLLWLLI